VASRYRALLIGNSTYPADEHNLQPLKGPVKDITVLNRALADPATGLFADHDGDGYVTFSELYAYVDRRQRDPARLRDGRPGEDRHGAARSREPQECLPGDRRLRSARVSRYVSFTPYLRKTQASGEVRC
jgi:hypothetical protein